MVATELSIYQSKRFKKNFRKASIVLQGLTQGAVHDFVRGHRSDFRTVARNYDRLANIRNVLEVDLTGGERLLAEYQDFRLYLLNMGGHEITNQYTKSMYLNDIGSAEPAPGIFFPENRKGFFTKTPDRNIALYCNEELTSEWAYYLTEQQENIFESTLERFLDLDPHRSLPSPIFIVGGPGTGKTCILLNLAKYLSELEETGYRPGLCISKSLQDYIRKFSGNSIHRYVKSVSTKGKYKDTDVLLVDDPKRYDINKAIDILNGGLIRGLILAFDPLQLDKSISDSDYDAVVKRSNAIVYELSDCYRQKEVVGIATKKALDTIAESTPFLRQDRIGEYQSSRSRLTGLANNINFINPHGYSYYYENFNVHHLTAEIRRILENDWLMWTHYPGLLIVLYDFDLSYDENETLAPLYCREYIQVIDQDEISDIKGLEYQHVFIFMKQKLFNEIQNGFSGTGRKVYEERRLLRIPLSRARDSLVVFSK